MVLGILAYFRAAGTIVSAFAPKGRISIRSVNSEGDVSVQDVDVHGDVDDAVRKMKNQLESEGNKVFFVMCPTFFEEPAGDMAPDVMTPDMDMEPAL